MSLLLACSCKGSCSCIIQIHNKGNMLFKLFNIYTNNILSQFLFRNALTEKSYSGKVGEQSSEQFIALQIVGGFKGVSAS